MQCIVVCIYYVCGPSAICCSMYVIPTSLSSLQGTVIIIANHGDRIDIPAGSMLENKIVSGNLRIMDH